MTKILIVEDSSIVAMHLRVFLEANGYSVIGKLDCGEDVESFIRLSPPDLILMDIMLAGVKTGIEAVLEIRAFSDIPVIFLSALTDSSSIDLINKISNCRKIGKPFIETELLLLITELITHPQ